MVIFLDLTFRVIIADKSNMGKCHEFEDVIMCMALYIYTYTYTYIHILINRVLNCSHVA